MAFGPNVRAWRILRGIGLNELARRLGISSAYLSRIESELDNPPDNDLMNRVATILEVKLDDLYFEEDRLSPGMGDHTARIRPPTREHIANSGLIDQTEKVVRFPTTPDSSTGNEGDEALTIVYHASELMRGMEDRAASVEARARSLVEDAIDKLRASTNKIRSLESERRTAETRIQDAEKALRQAELRIASVEEELSQAELRARRAEARASRAEKSLIRIEDAIRSHLYFPKSIFGRSDDANKSGVARKAD